MFAKLLVLSLFFLAISLLAALYRLIRGQSIPDRIMALDAIGVNIIAVVAVLSIWQDTDVFMEVILVIGILSFIGTIALTKFIERGVVIESKRDD